MCMMYSPMFDGSFSFDILSLQCMHSTLNDGRGKVPLYINPVSSASTGNTDTHKKIKISQSITLQVIEKTLFVNSVPVSFHDQS